MGQDDEWVTIKKAEQDFDMYRGSVAYIINKSKIKPVKKNNRLHYNKKELYSAIRAHKSAMRGEIQASSEVNDPLLSLVLKMGFSNKFNYKKHLEKKVSP